MDDSQTTFTLVGDGGSSQTISNGNTLTIEGGDGISTTKNTDKVSGGYTYIKCSKCIKHKFKNGIIHR